MKNSAVKAMITNQFNQLDANDITVKFDYSTLDYENYEVTIVEDDDVRKFDLKIEFKERM